MPSGYRIAYTVHLPSRQWLSNTPTATLHRDKTPKSVLDMTLNNLIGMFQ